MNKTIKTLTAVSVLAASTLVSGVAMAESDLTANAGVTSNYIWRGMTQTNDNAAISGGIDYSSPVGVYVGLWNSNTNDDAETDLYVGYAGEAGDLGYDVGYISYIYNDTGPGVTSDFSEFYVGGSFQMFSLKISLSSDLADTSTLDIDTMYVEVGADIPLNDDLTLGLHFGNYDYATTSTTTDFDVNDYSISLSKDDFTISYSATSEDGTVIGANSTDNARIAVSWSHGIEL